MANYPFYLMNQPWKKDLVAGQTVHISIGHNLYIRCVVEKSDLGTGFRANALIGEWEKEFRGENKDKEWYSYYHFRSVKNSELKDCDPFSLFEYHEYINRYDSLPPYKLSRFYIPEKFLEEKETVVPPRKLPEHLSMWPVTSEEKSNRPKKSYTCTTFKLPNLMTLSREMYFHTGGKVVKYLRTIFQKGSNNDR